MPRCVLVVAAVFVCAVRAQDLQLVQRDAYLMGTRAVLAAYAADRRTGMATLESALDVLEATEAQLSTWRSDSAVSQLNRAPLGQAWRADATLCRLLADLYEWHEQTAGTFDPAIGALADAWQIHARGRMPSAAELAAARGLTGLELLDFNPHACTLTRRGNATIDVGAFGKGEALDRVARQLTGRSWIVDLGGQVSVGGVPPDGKPWIVDIAHPLNRERPIMQIELGAGSLSTSGGSERDEYVGDVRVGHILDPRSGRPATFTGSVIVWHERALVADIVSTALYVMGPEEGLRWAESRRIAAAYLIPTNHGVATAATSSFARLKPAVVADDRR
jgi:FAD:protein FMN transferase